MSQSVSYVSSSEPLSGAASHEYQDSIAHHQIRESCNGMSNDLLADTRGSIKSRLSAVVRPARLVSHMLTVCLRILP